MSGSVVWATVVGLLLGCVIGVAGMGALLLPVQFKLEQDQIRSKQELLEMEEQRNHALEKFEDAEAKRQQGVIVQQRQTLENRQWAKRYADKVSELEEANRKLKLKP